MTAMESVKVQVEADRRMSQLNRLRWAVRAALGLGVTVSIAANVLHARPNPVSQAIAGWPPIALLLTVELISRIPVAGRTRATVRVLATAIIAGIAAWVSYWHMAGVAARYGETTTSAHLLPLSVDGLVVVASICLVELSARMQTTSRPTSPGSNDACRCASLAAPGAPATTGSSIPAEPARPAAKPDRITAAAKPSRQGRAATLAAPSASVASDAAYTPTTDEDRSMYEAWLLATRTGRRISGAELARAAGRTGDSTGVGRRAARRYREAHEVSASAEHASVTTPLSVVE